MGVGIIGQRTEHFIHEFYHFARSPLCMITYDQRAEYEAAATTINDTDSDGSDVIVVGSDAAPTTHASWSGREPPAVRRLLDWDTTPLLERVNNFLNSTTSNSGWDSPT